MAWVAQRQSKQPENYFFMPIIKDTSCTEGKV